MQDFFLSLKIIKTANCFKDWILKEKFGVYKFILHLALAALSQIQSMLHSILSSIKLSTFNINIRSSG